jgi:hypothetical protein
VDVDVKDFFDNLVSLRLPPLNTSSSAPARLHTGKQDFNRTPKKEKSAPAPKLRRRNATTLLLSAAEEERYCAWLQDVADKSAAHMKRRKAADKIAEAAFLLHEVKLASRPNVGSATDTECGSVTDTECGSDTDTECLWVTDTEFVSVTDTECVSVTDTESQPSLEVTTPSFGAPAKLAEPREATDVHTTLLEMWAREA